MKPRTGKKFIFRGEPFEVIDVLANKLVGINLITRQAYNFVAGADGGYNDLLEMKMSKEKANSVDDISMLLGKAIRIVTLEGAIRTATLSKIVTRSIIIDSVTIEFPYQVYLNGDSNDFIMVDSIESINSLSKA